MIDDVTFYLVTDEVSGELKGYAAYGTAEFWSGRRGLRRKRTAMTKLMSNLYMLDEGNPPGFGICDDEEVALYRQGAIRYRGVRYALESAPGELTPMLWDEYLGETFE